MQIKRLRINLLASDAVEWNRSVKHIWWRRGKVFVMAIVVGNSKASSACEKSFSRLGRIQSGKLKNTFTHVNWKSKHDSHLQPFDEMLLDANKKHRFIMLMVKNYDEQFSIVFKRRKNRARRAHGGKENTSNNRWEDSFLPSFHACNRQRTSSHRHMMWCYLTSKVWLRFFNNSVLCWCRWWASKKNIWFCLHKRFKSLKSCAMIKEVVEWLQHRPKYNKIK